MHTSLILRNMYKKTNPTLVYGYKITLKLQLRFIKITIEGIYLFICAETKVLHGQNTKLHSKLN